MHGAAFCKFEMDNGIAGHAVPPAPRDSSAKARTAAWCKFAFCGCTLLVATIAATVVMQLLPQSSAATVSCASQIDSLKRSLLEVCVARTSNNFQICSKQVKDMFTDSFTVTAGQALEQILQGDWDWFCSLLQAEPRIETHRFGLWTGFHTRSDTCSVKSLIGWAQKQRVIIDFSTAGSQILQREEIANLKKCWGDQFHVLHNFWRYWSLTFTWVQALKLREVVILNNKPSGQFQKSHLYEELHEIGLSLMNRSLNIALKHIHILNYMSNCSSVTDSIHKLLPVGLDYSISCEEVPGGCDSLNNFRPVVAVV
eukprot:TRINITY_DN6541_c1_g1_i1.p1 TRINITY_DN6541_c1_g1~~TRINITY_DN6541_c1_g1_i1.p1  ORF type:complete len:312 (+),score=23.37 TRINITY_DN6541_c1_g1_i1:62-997(+)